MQTPTTVTLPRGFTASIACLDDPGDPHAIEDDVRARPESRFEGGGEAGGRRIQDQVGSQCGRELASPGHRIADSDALHGIVLQPQHRHEPDRPGAHDEHPLVRIDLGLVGRVASDGAGLGGGGYLDADVLGDGQEDRLPQHHVVRKGAVEFRAVCARHTRREGTRGLAGGGADDAVAGGPLGNIRPNLDDLGDELVAHDHPLVRSTFAYHEVGPVSFIMASR